MEPLSIPFSTPLPTLLIFCNAQIINNLHYFKLDKNRKPLLMPMAYALMPPLTATIFCITKLHSDLQGKDSHTMAQLLLQIYSM